jgi:hypothetical protein
VKSPRHPRQAQNLLLPHHPHVSYSGCYSLCCLTALRQAAEPPFDPSDQMFNSVPFDSGFPFQFGSEAANMEYAILSSILGTRASPPEVSRTPPPLPDAPYTTWPSDDPMEFGPSQRLGGATEFAPPYPDQQIAVQPSDTTLSTSPTANYLTYSYQQPPDQDQPQYPSQFQQELHPLQPRFPLDGRPRSPTLTSISPSQSAGPSFAHNGMPEYARQGGGSQLQKINDRVTMPYDYTEGYHFLMKHLPGRCVCYFQNQVIVRKKECLWDSSSDFFPLYG